jgi:hypothetical protein
MPHHIGNALVYFDIEPFRAEISQASGEFAKAAKVSSETGSHFAGNIDGLESRSRAVCGLGRATQDLDLCLTPEDMPAALRCLTRHGFRCQAKDPVWLHQAHRHGFFIDLITGMSNAVIAVNRSWIERSTPTMILDVRVRVLAAEELLASKLFVVRRERFDGADYRPHYLCQPGPSRLGESPRFDPGALGNSALRSGVASISLSCPRPLRAILGMATLVGGFSNELTNRDPAAEFRGSLVDDKMFAIDVAEWGMENMLNARRAQARVATNHSRQKVHG